MPIYEGIGSDKNSVILEFGTAYSRCGFTSEPSPRAIVPSNIYFEPYRKIVNIFEIQDELHAKKALEKYIQMIYFRYLAVNPKDRRVVVVESVFAEKSFREKLANILFKSLDVPSVIMVPSHVVSMATLGIRTALVVDIGYQEAISIPVFEGVTLLDAVQFAPLGGKSLHRRIMDELIQRKAFYKENETVKILKEEILNESILEDIKFKTCFVTTRERGSLLAQQKLDKSSVQTEEIACKITDPPRSIKYPFGGSQILHIPGSLRESVCELLFEMYGEEHTLPTLILDSILKCPLDCRKVLASNVVLIGGTSMIPGLKIRLLSEIEYLAKFSVRYERFRDQLRSIKIKFHRLPCKENYASWLGASIFSTTELLTMRSITSKQYAQNNEKMTDWSDFEVYIESK
ncbi:actin-related protein 10-like protein [Sarcoptes scabiei]|uniref:Actin-related protein 10 n=1 Tax=Sarcoptes scabiei TaxID=52283 RepID=A0A132A7G6_SARSC|nr:actin-related protein 10-like protein [Sarcoptes scabiei]